MNDPVARRRWSYTDHRPGNLSMRFQVCLLPSPPHGAPLLPLDANAHAKRNACTEVTCRASFNPLLTSHNLSCHMPQIRFLSHVVIFFIVCCVLLFFVKVDTCSSFVETFLGFSPLHVSP